MAYNHTPYGFGGPPFFNDNMPQDELRGQDELSMTGSWYTQIDPSLSKVDPSILGLQMSSQGSTPMAFQVQQDVQIQSREYQQQPPMQRYVNEQQLALFTANSSQVFPHGLTQPGAPTQSLPQTGYMRHASPSLSQGLSSTCTSAQSPSTESDWGFYSQGRDEFGIRRSMDCYSNSPRFAESPTQYESAPANCQHYALPQSQGNSCVNMSQVQGFADPEEVTFEADEGFEEMNNMKAEYNLDSSDRQEIKLESHYRNPELEEYHYTDSAVGSSIKDMNSPENTSIHAGADDAASDIDADGEMDGDAIEVDPASDTEYTPRSTRTRKRPSTSSSKPTLSKKNRIVKSTPNSKSKLTCKSCNAAPFKDAVSLSRHVASAHTRAFVCVFSFAGCPSTFASKNEWKRHVLTQHLNLTAWVCDLGACSQPTKSSPFGGAEFNRKDLFAQHLRRMHAPSAVKRKGKGSGAGADEKWEKEIRELQKDKARVKRSPPRELGCPVQGCGGFFEGTNAWDERMEHVGKHLEKAGEGEVDQANDGLLVRWAVREGIVEERSGGRGFRLVVGGGHVRREEDLDAEGEME